MRLRILFLVCCALAPLVRATSVVPPTFPELVAEADGIYRARVAGVEARRVARPDGGSVIKTFVSLAIDRVLKGTAETGVTLEFLGGTIGDETLEVGGVPRFTVGEKGILFVQKNGRQFCPLVRLGHGSYRIERDSMGRDYITRDNRAPLRDVAEVELPLGESRAAVGTAPDPVGALSSAAFESRITNEVQRPTLNARPL